jgi:transcriptional regulator with XRE-family HTH domain
MNRDPAKTIGDRIHARREALGLTLTELAAPGLSRTHIHLIELGQRRPSMKALRPLAQALGVSPYWLETGREDPAIELAREVLKRDEAATPKMRRLARQILR